MKKTIAILVGLAGLILAPYCFREAHAQYTPPVLANACGVGSLCASGSISSAQLLAANGTPVTLIPAQGAGTVVIVQHGIVESVPGSGAYAGSGNIQFLYGSGTNTVAVGAASFCSSSIFTSLTVQTCTGGAVNNATATATTSTVNQSVQFKMGIAQDTCASPPCGTLNYWLSYKVLTGF